MSPNFCSHGSMHSVPHVQTCQTIRNFSQFYQKKCFFENLTKMPKRVITIIRPSKKISSVLTPSDFLGLKDQTVHTIHQK